MYVVNLEMDNSPKQVLFNMKRSDTKAVFTLGAQALVPGHRHNGAVFRHMVPSLKIRSHSINRAHAHY